MLIENGTRCIVASLAALSWNAAWAQTFPITVDKNARGAKAAVGISHDVPVIHIVPPSAGGVSHNRFVEFNVGPAGAVLNNSGGASQTQIAGHIAGNPMLGNKQASIILNEVTAANPTQLRGMLEVAGHRAHVILANPAGITCDGCGFLNTSRATLATGRPILGPKGDITLDVAAGKLQIEGDGLNGTHAGQVDLLARALVLNAGVWTDRLNVVAGAARVEAVSGQAKAQAGKGPKPKIALDTAALGGMYANSIRLIGTESGVGVNVGGNLVALTGDLSLSAAGDIRIEPNAALTAKQKLTINTTGQLDTRHATLHAGNVALTAQTLRNQQGSITSENAASLRIQGAIYNADGMIAATGKHHLKAGQLHNVGGTVAGGTLTIVVDNGVDNRKGLIMADQALQLKAARLVNQDTLLATKTTTLSASAAAPTATVTSTPLSTGVSAKTAAIRVTQLDNSKGSIQVSSDLTVSADELKNPSGLISAQGNARVDTRLLNNRGGTLAATKHLSVGAKQLDGLGWLQSAGDMTFTYGGALTPLGNFIVGRDLHLELGGKLVNKSKLVAGRDLRIKAEAFVNTPTGELLGGRHAVVDVAHVADNSGLIDSKFTRINAAKVLNRGRIYGDLVSVNAGELINDAGPKGAAVMASRGNLKIGVGTLVNRHHSVLYGKTHLRVGGALDGVGNAVGEAALVENVSSTIEAGSSLILAARQVQNQNADFASKTVQLSSKRKVYFTPEGSTDMYDAATTWLCDTVTRACSHDPHWLKDDPQRRLLLPSKKYPASRYGPLFDYAPYARGAAGVSSPIALTYTPASGRPSIDNRSYRPEKFRYPRDSRIWTVFGVPPPSQDLPARPRPELSFTELSNENARSRRKAVPYEERPEYKEYKARHLALDARIRAFNRDFLNRLVKHFTFYEVNEVVTQTRTVRSDPARILSGGYLTVKGAVTNDKSQIAAAGKLSVEGPAINNVGATGWKTITREGQATFTQARSGDRKAHRSPYKVTVSSTPFDLPVGPLRSALAPKVLVPARLDTSQAYGTIMAGRKTLINSPGNVHNSGTIGAREATVINASNIVNHSGGQILAHRVYLAARENLTVLAGRIQGNIVALRAGQNINLISTENSEDHGNTAGTHLAGVTQVSATDLTMQAGHDINMLAAKVSVERDARLQAGRDIRLDALTATHHETISSGRHQRHELSTQKAIGSTAHAKGDLELSAGQDVGVRAAEIHAQQQLSVLAGRDILISPGIDSGSASDEFREKKKGLLSSKTEATKVSGQWEQTQASTLTGKNIEISAGRDVKIQGSNVGAVENLDIEASRAVDIEPGGDERGKTRAERIQKSGVGAMGGMSVGSSKQTHTVLDEQKTTLPAMIGSLEGDTTIRSGQAVNVTGSTIVAAQGNLTIESQRVTIGAAKDTYRRQESFDLKNRGFSVDVSTPLLDIAETIDGLSNAAGKSGHSVIQKLASVAALVDTGRTIEGVRAQGEAPSATPVDKIGGVRVSVQAGSSQQSYRSFTHASEVIGATVNAGKDLRISAAGDSNDASIDVTGSILSAGRNLHLDADGAINLHGGRSTVDINRHEKGASSAIGVGFSVGSSNGAGLAMHASASENEGAAQGHDESILNTRLSAGERVALRSGANMVLNGAVVSGESVTLEVGDDLHVESLQDLSTFQSKDQSVSGGMVMGAGVFGTANVAHNDVRGNYASVTEQSGIQAGDGGFDVRVGGNTHLKGAALLSTHEAAAAGLNRLTTGTLTVSDIENHSEHAASGVVLDVSIGASLADTALSPGFSKIKGSVSSTTHSGLSAATVTITDHASQRRLTGKTAEQLLDRLHVPIDSETGVSGISKTWDPEKLRSKVAAEAEVIAAFTQQVGQTIRAYTNEKRNELQARLKAKSDEDEKLALQQQIDALNTQERVMSVIVGALTGSVGIATAHAALSEAADQMRQYAIADSKKFRGITDGVTTLDNQSGKSAGIRGDGFNLAGARLDLDTLCGPDNRRCKVQRDANGKPLLDAQGIPKLALSADGMVQFTAPAEGGLAAFLETPEGKNMAGFTGGVQGMPSTFAGLHFRAGGLMDLLHEAYGGTHDFIGGTLSGLYDDEGNAQRGRNSAQKIFHEVWSAAALLPSTPFALAEILPPEVWRVLDILMELKR